MKTYLVVILLWCVPGLAANPHVEVKIDGAKCGAVFGDYSQSAVYEARIFQTPKTEDELVKVVKNAGTSVSVLGGGFSMGGQVSTSQKGVTVDMAKYNKILDLNVGAKTITVQAGVTWKQIQEAIYRHGLAVKVMQSYNSFQAGGSLSVNVHGRYVGFGPVISTVRSIRVLLADGRVLSASRNENSDLFYGAIGGYGGLGIILEATLDLADNVKLERRWKEFSNPEGDLARASKDYLRYFSSQVAGNPDAVMTNADIYPPNYDTIRAISYYRTEKALTVEEHLQKPEMRRWKQIYNSTLHSLEQLLGFVKRFRAQHYEPKILAEEKVVYRNWEAGSDVGELTPLNQRFPILKKIFTVSNRKALLQEYFIPVDQLSDFLPKMKAVFQAHDVNVSNVSIRHVPKNDESLLSWSGKESFALVIYYTQDYGGDKAAKLAKARRWTQEMLDHVLASGGSFYLPYQIYARTDQFRRAYPRFAQYEAAKKKYDPKNKFSNRLIDTYVGARETFHFQTMLESEMERVDMLEFFRNIFGIVNPQAHMTAIKEAYAQLKVEGIETNDRNMYERLQRVLPKYVGNPIAKGVRSIVSLRAQQQEMARETSVLLNRIGRTRFNGYIEVGTPGRYAGYLKGDSKLNISGPTYVVNEAEPGLFNPVDMLERTGGYGGFDPRSYTSALSRSHFVDLSDYDMIPQTEVPNQSVDLASVFIGLHHAPPHKLRQFIASINRVLRPDGILVLRDHDVNSDRMHRMASLAHSTFNAGLGAPYESEIQDIRNFHDLGYWIKLLREAGFELATDERMLQAGDPTLNTLLAFKKVRTAPESVFADPMAISSEPYSLTQLKSLKDYFRPGNHTYMVGPEWFFVDFSVEYGAFQARLPWYLFPFDKYMDLSRKIYAGYAKYAKLHGIDDKVAFDEYDKMDRALIQANSVLYWCLQQVAKFTKWSLRKETPPQTTGFVVQDLTPAQIQQFSQGLLKEVVNLKDEMVLLATQRQMPFTQAMIELAAHEDAKLLEVAGNTDISVLFVSKTPDLSSYSSSFSTLDGIVSYEYPTPESSWGMNMHIHSVKIHVSELGRLIRTINKNGDKLMRVHDF